MGRKINFQDYSPIRFLHFWFSIKILSKQIHLIQISVSLIEPGIIKTPLTTHKSTSGVEQYYTNQKDNVRSYYHP